MINIKNTVLQCNIFSRTDFKRKGVVMVLTKLVGRIYKICFEISLWLNLIIFAIAGGILGRQFSYYDNFTGLGVFGGLIIGFIISVLCGGFVIKLLNLDE